MSYDPTKDEPVFTQREVEQLITDTAREAAREAFTAGVEAALGGIAGLPLSIEGRWKLDTIYQAGALVYHRGEQWLAKCSTASEPSLRNALWRRVNLPGLEEPA